MIDYGVVILELLLTSFLLADARHGEAVNLDLRGVQRGSIITRSVLE